VPGRKGFRGRESEKRGTFGREDGDTLSTDTANELNVEKAKEMISEREGGRVPPLSSHLGRGFITEKP